MADDDNGYAEPIALCSFWGASGTDGDAQTTKNGRTGAPVTITVTAPAASVGFSERHSQGQDTLAVTIQPTTEEDEEAHARNEALRARMTEVGNRPRNSVLSGKVSSVGEYDGQEVFVVSSRGHHH